MKIPKNLFYHYFNIVNHKLNFIKNMTYPSSFQIDKTILCQLIQIDDDEFLIVKQIKQL